MAASTPATGRRWYHPLPLAKRIAFLAVILYVADCVFLFSIQNSLTYPIKATGADLPTDKAIRLAGELGLVPWRNATPGASSPQGYVRFDFTRSTPRGTIVVFHGNGGWCYDRTEYLVAFTQRGFRVFLYEYPGYGGRPGRPGESAIVPDGQALIRSLDQAGFGPVYVWGESLGAGVAAAVCGDPALPVHGLVLLTPWDNIANVGLSFYPFIPVRLLMIDRYDSVANLEHFAHPVCIVRSSDDEVIPPPLTLNLYAHLPEPKKMIVHQGCGHNSWPNTPSLPWWDEALDFIAPKPSP
jgi:alpha-beta hydrolase superfamily lysophospholipase